MSCYRPLAFPRVPSTPTATRLAPGTASSSSSGARAEFDYEVALGPEGELFVPNVGVLYLGDRSLADARELVREAVLKVFTNVKVDLILTGLREFKVHVVGAIQKSGAYPATAVSRVSQMLELAGGLLETASLRAIHIRDRNGEESIVDFVAYNLTGRLEMNPYVGDGHVIEVPRRVRSSLISGAVVNPGVYEPIPGERLSDLLIAIGGLRPSVDSSRVTVSRFVGVSTTEERTFAFRPGGGELADPEVRDGDRYFFRERTNWHRSAEVHVQGEVVRPGRYPISLSGARLRDVIEMAGGFTAEASLTQSHILRLRERWTPPPFEPTSDATDADRAALDYVMANEALDSVLVVCDFVSLFRDSVEAENVVLRDGDIIQVPEDRNEVRVIGRVRSPGSFPYQEGITVGDYINIAGGFDKDADKGRTRVARFSGGPMAKVGGDDLVPSGAVIFVPAKDRRGYLERTRALTAILLQVASIIVIVNNLVN